MISYRCNPPTKSAHIEGTDPMAKKAAKKRSSKKKPSKKAFSSTPKIAKEDTRSAISREFDCRAGSKKEKVIEALKAGGVGKYVERGELLKAAYGSKNEENAGKLAMVLKGVVVDAKELKLGYTLEKKKDAETKELSFGLHTK